MASQKTKTQAAEEGRGGKREGAGRPSSGKKTVEVSFDPDFLNAVDSARGDTPRGEFLEQQCFHLNRMKALGDRLRPIGK